MIYVGNSLAKEKFAGVSKVNLRIQTSDSTFDETLLHDYWKKYSTQQVDSPVCNKLLSNPMPVMDKDRVYFYIDHEALYKFFDDIFPKFKQPTDSARLSWTL